MDNSLRRVFINPQAVIRDVYPGDDHKMLRIAIREYALYHGKGYDPIPGVIHLAPAVVPGYVLGIMAATYTVGDTAARFTYL